ncbi:NnrS family protein [Donghicola mangrovi]|uniref:NnrS family protein n=1 Tax=Donghicola mangrovi TaxID=2729614 RepID=A0A850Q6H2_9RHOB|nr:NnrS family protein [Donghicola mangrovi]NVO25357.1 NnrS family protein [Donghicola mangrovi]
MFEPGKRLISAGYRVFFFLAGAWAVAAMLLWELWLAGLRPEPYAMAASEWHAHELIFGYGSAALAGFLLTAAPNWTKARDASTAFFAVVSGLWLAGRLAMWVSSALPLGLVALIDLTVLPVVAGKVLAMLLKRPKPPQMLILAAIALIWVADLFMHLDWLGLMPGAAFTGARAGLLGLAALIVILGGRVTPAFTRNAMIRTGREDRLPRNPMPLAAVSIAPALLAAPALLFGFDSLAAGLALLAGAIALLRVALWRGGWTLGQPILWVLHLSYALNALGLVLWGLSGLGVEPEIVPEIAALHLLAIGGIGGMTLAVMSRAALGHSGRALVAPRPVALAYGLVPLAALLRMLGALVPGLYLPALLAAGALWTLGFLLYTLALTPVFWGAKVSAAKA